MKRATLTAYPTTPPTVPADLTDRLLQREDGPASAPVSRRRRRQNADSQIKPETKLAGLETALAAADSATEALRQAAREAPARYEVALHYRLDALAYHLQQVKEFVAAMAAR